MKNVAMLYHGNNEELHPAHRGFAESIDADVLPVSDTSPHSTKSFYQECKAGYSIGDYDIVIAEGSRPLYTGLIHKLIHGSKLIYLCADHRLHQIWNSTVQVKSIYSLLKHVAGTYGKPVIRAIAQRGVDGIIAVSDFVTEYLRPIFDDRVPTRIVHPYIQEDVYNRLVPTEPDLSENVALTVGRDAHYKGVDLLVEAWPAVRAEHPDAELHIVGSGHSESFAETDGVEVHGFVEDIVDAYADASLYVQPSRVDPFPVTVLEALCAGLPAVVTESTGSRSEIREIDERLISPVSASGLSDCINWYFDLPVDSRQELSEVAKSRGTAFSPEAQKQRFHDEFHQLCEEIQ
ncbi:glycosyltransferase family 4 protein [Salinigranum sp. GCM10025319]|uniref:glycosyltransferase family 4 protein n=1 Tax=Salinigranum sp. GCM10025319 TaxID=3252687 RepID=UPI00360D9DA0